MSEAIQPLSRFGVYLFPWGKEPPTAEALVGLAQTAERLGFDSVHVPWHSTLPEGRFDWGNRYVLDPLILLPLVISGTTHIRVAIDCAPVTLHHPFLWAQYIASAEILSDGRLLAGLTMPYWKEDFQTGMARPGEGPDRFDEALETITKLWRGEPILNAGRFWDSRGLQVGARPSADMPIWLGTGLNAPGSTGLRSTESITRSLERAARYASGVHSESPSWEEVQTLLRPGLDAAAERLGRGRLSIAIFNYCVVTEASDDPIWVRDHVMATLRNRLGWQAPDRLIGDEPDDSVIVGSAEQCAARLAQMFAAGVDYVVFDVNFHGWEPPDGFGTEQLHRLAERVVPLLQRDLGGFVATG
jgi:alkanesulfonate monooxygenase SsuD/methylene tetrahydromethanopterin reductase-like flavin-dependent oxidoreductase (luciferase family)